MNYALAVVYISGDILQGDPKKIPPTKMLITSTYVQRFTSYVMHINFSLCRIIPQSFQSVRHRQVAKSIAYDINEVPVASFSSRYTTYVKTDVKPV